MQVRIDYAGVSPEGTGALLKLNEYVSHCSIDSSLLDLVELRASQLNGCEYYVDMHRKDALASGESEQRLSALANWRESTLFSDRERCALAWTEAVTTLSKGHVTDEVYEYSRRCLSEKQLVDLTFAIIEINGWNRLALAFRALPGHYRPTEEPMDQVDEASDESFPCSDPPGYYAYHL